MYIILRFQEDFAIFLAHGQLYQPGATAGPTYTRTAGGGITRTVRGTQQVRAKSIEKITFYPIQFEGTVCAPIEIGMRDAIEANRKRGGHFAMTAHDKTHATPAFNQFAAAANERSFVRCNHA